VKIVENGIIKQLFSVGFVNLSHQFVYKMKMFYPTNSSSRQYLEIKKLLPVIGFDYQSIKMKK